MDDEYPRRQAPFASRTPTQIKPWERFRTGSFVGDTGWGKEVIHECFIAIPGILGDTIDIAFHQLLFYEALKYVQHYPTKGQWKTVMKISYSSYSRHALNLLETFVSSANFISWDGRLDEDNHHRHFPLFVTGVVDGFPIQIRTPLSPEARRLTNQGKYKYTCLKGEMVIDLKGNPRQMTFPFIGVRGDQPVSLLAVIIFSS